jgi:hypothetical protein
LRTEQPCLVPVAVDGKTLRGSFDAFADKKAVHMLSALRLRIPTKPATHSNRKPATDSDLKPAGVPI